MGGFHGRVWKHKKIRLEYLLRWATNGKAAVVGDPNQWILNKATERYKQWRKGEDFQRTLESCAQNVKKWWQDKYPDIDQEDMAAKVSYSAFANGMMSVFYVFDT
jgi:hypothetical protein